MSYRAWGLARGRSGPSGDLFFTQYYWSVFGLLFADTPVPNEHAYFMEPAEPYSSFIGFPRQFGLISNHGSWLSITRAMCKGQLSTLLLRDRTVPS